MPTEIELFTAMTARLHEAYPEGQAYDEEERARWEGPLMELAGAMRNNYPYSSPFFVGQMLKPPHPVARLAYSLSLFVNPNNHALDGSLATAPMEKEAVAALAQMFGWEAHLGHLTSGGTLANLEALWASGRLRPGVILASSAAHYTHQRISGVLGLGFEAIACDEYGRMSPEALAARLKQGGVSAVVATLGSTGLGAIDPLQEILPLARERGVRVHVDAAYGGFFKLAEAELSESAAAAFAVIDQADSIAVDPHKHGLQPYGCGAILFQDPSVGQLYKHDSPYTYFSSEELHLGEISLECSRPGSAAAALWATQRRFPLTPDGEFSAGLSRCLQAARQFHERLGADEGWRRLHTPELDIVVYAPKAATASETDALSQAIFDEAAGRDLHLAMMRLDKAQLAPLWPDLKWDVPELRCLRSTFMKWEHLAHLDEIWKRLSESAVAARA